MIVTGTSAPAQFGHTAFIARVHASQNVQP